VARCYAEEHARFDVDDRLTVDIGGHARLISRYALPTVTLHDALPAFRGDEVADVGPMYPCGPGRHGFLNRPQADMQLRTSARS
jgi:hypothetical protein